ncbi:MAG: metallophosphoesterase [Desulfurococcales archaeon ex4484_42]|nr:MAG: metallophosphoesterase [Desulfurococcales archaeon ex4484_42]
MPTVRFCAVGDIHGTRYFSIFKASLKSIVGFKPDAFILAGDLVDEGKVDDLEYIIREIKSKFPSVPIFAVFGNEEYHELEAEFVNRYTEVIWLNDTPALYYINGVKVGLIGTRGALDKLTFWQRKHKPELEITYRERPKLIKSMIKELRRYADIIILVSHYAPVFITVKGEPEKVYPYMGSREMERVIREVKPDIVIHAHAHNARIVDAVVDGVKVYNVSLPARKGITLIEARPRTTLLGFLRAPSKVTES